MLRRAVARRAISPDRRIVELGAERRFSVSSEFHQRL